MKLAWLDESVSSMPLTVLQQNASRTYTSRPIIVARLSVPQAADEPETRGAPVPSAAATPTAPRACVCYQRLDWNNDKCLERWNCLDRYLGPVDLTNRWMGMSISLPVLDDGSELWRML
jgi:hypothetical protein